MAKNGPNDLIFGLWLVIMMLKNPVEPILKILIFGQILRFLGQKQWFWPKKYEKIAKKMFWENGHFL